MTKLLVRTSTLLILFLLSLLLVWGFSVWTPSVGGTILDSVGPVSEVQDLLSRMTGEQKSSHFRMTALLDMLFPLAYGGVFYGLVHRHIIQHAQLLSLPALAVIAVDLAENCIQLLALSGYEGLLAAKAILTPLKFLLFNVAMLIAVIALCFGLFIFVRSRRNPD